MVYNFGHRRKKMKVVDLYTEKYTGELETILIEKDPSDQVVYELKLFRADFSCIIDWLPFDISSDRESLVYILNTNSSWGEDFSEVYKTKQFYDQLLLIGSEVHSFDLPVFNAIKQICESVLQNNNRLFIKIE